MKSFVFFKSKLQWSAAICASLTLLFLALFFVMGKVALAENKRIITIFHDGVEEVVVSDAEKVGDVLERANIKLEKHDSVEPSADSQLVAANYNINVYRARPVTVIDGNLSYKIMTSYTSAHKIAKAAGVQTVDEDQFELSRIDDFVSDRGAGLKLTIKRSTPLKMVIYGNTVDAHTQSKTVAGLLKEKKIKLGKDDGVSPGLDSQITADMTVAIYRNGVQTVNQEQDVDFSIEQIKDADREVGYREIKEPGQKGKKLVTYQIEMRDGQEVSRKEIQSVVTQQPKRQLEIVGIKVTGFSGDFAEALAKLRSCEGSYTSVNPIGYYGAYQFNQTTWNGAAPAGYSGVRPDQAPPEVQDQAARNLYERRGWQPWPACSRSLGLQDIYR